MWELTDVAMLLCSLSSVTLRLLTLQALMTGLLEAVGEVHFTDAKRGRISWIIEKSALPWSGQYYYTEAHGVLFTDLLVVVDSSNGNHLGNCMSFAPRDDQWRRFHWILTEDALVCNVTHTESTISKVHFSSSAPPSSFSVRILAVQGPRCFRDMIVQNERMDGCPPRLQRNSFQQMNLECGCDSVDSVQLPSSANSSASHGTFHFANPNAFLLGQNPSVFPNLHISPLPQLSKETPAAGAITAATAMPPTVHAPVLFPAATAPAETVIAAEANGEHAVPNPQVPLGQPHGAVPAVADRSLHQVPSITFVDSMANAPFGGGFHPATNTSFAAAAQVPPNLSAHPCAGIQCQNGGTCVVGGDGKALCMCAAGYSGSLCETNLCDAVRCQNNGVCQVDGSTPQCRCLPGTSGPFCEQVTCNPTCEQGGLCILSSGVPICLCPPGLAGVNCNVRDMCTASPEICSYYGAQARCQTDARSFTLVSPVLVNATYRCLCQDIDSEWILCSHLKPQHSEGLRPSLPSSVPSVPHPAESDDAVSSSGVAKPTFDFQQEAPRPQNVEIPLAATTTPHPVSNASITVGAIWHDGNSTSDFGIGSQLGTGEKDVDPIEAVQSTSGFHSSASATESNNRSLAFEATVVPSLASEAHANTAENMTRSPVVDIDEPERQTSSPATPTDNMTAGYPISRVPSTAKAGIHEGGVESKFEALTVTSQVASRPSVTTPEALSVADTANTEAALASEVDLENAERLPPESDRQDEDSSSARDVTKTVIPEVPLNRTALTWYHHTEQAEEITSPEDTTEASTASTEDAEVTVKPVSPDDDGFTQSVGSPTSTGPPQQTTQELPSSDDDQIKFFRITVGLPTTSAVDSDQGNGVTDRNQGASKAGSPWPVVLSAVFALLILSTICGLLIFRYVRRSRKLHGKYNPAREESALSGGYAVPMTAVTKEERLI